MIVDGIGMVRLLVMDVDGTLTDGKIYIGEQGELMKAFSVKDGLGIKKVLETDLIPIILTGRESKITTHRANELGITEVYQGKSDKVETLDELCKKHNCSYDEVIYIGDDENDLACMKLCKYVAAPYDACELVKIQADYICENVAGNGAVRELIEYILKKCKETLIENIAETKV